MYLAARSHDKVLPESTHKEGKSILFWRLNLKNVSLPRSLGPEVHCQAQRHPAAHITDLKDKKPFAPVLGRSDGDLTVRCWLHEPGWPGCQAGSLFRAGAILVLHEETSMITKRLEAVRMRIVLSALLLLVWFPGLARRAWLHGKYPTQFAGISV